MIEFKNKIVQFGFGAVGKSFFEKISKEIKFDKDKYFVISRERLEYTFFLELGGKMGNFIIADINRENFKKIFSEYLDEGDLLIDFADSVGTKDFIEWCAQKNIMYLNTGETDWSDNWYNIFDENLKKNELRDQLEQKSNVNKYPIVLQHGNNPGLVSHFVKAAIEYIIARQGRQSLTDKTKNAIQETINDSIKLINHCKHIYIKLAQNISQEAINEFDSAIAEMENARNEDQFSEVKKKDVQLEYKAELRKIRIFHCIIDLYNSSIEAFNIHNIIDDIKKQNYNQAELNETANSILGMVQSLHTYFATGTTNNPEQDKEIRILSGKNMLDMIYKAAYDVEQIMHLMHLMKNQEC